MAARPIPADVLSETVAAVKLYGTQTAAADALGVNRLTFAHRYRVALSSANCTQGAECAIQGPAVAPLAPQSITDHPNCRIGRVSYKDEGRVRTVLAIGDAHDKPGRDKERFRWFGRMAADISPDAIVSIGDWASLDSLSTHEQPGSANDAARPAFHEELDSLDESLSLFINEFGSGAIPVYHTHGNHEFRTVRAANRQPKLNGDMPVRLDGTFHRYRIDTRPFGEALDLFGVDFVHCWLNKMGREVGGDNLNLIANKCSRSFVMGHTHINGVFNQAKYGHDGGKSRKITVVNLGTSMPYGMVEKYSGLSTTGWGYGLYVLRIRDGEIISAKHWDMLEIEARYGD